MSRHDTWRSALLGAALDAVVIGVGLWLVGAL